MDVEADCGEEDERRSNGVTEKVVKEVERRVRRNSVVKEGRIVERRQGQNGDRSVSEMEVVK